MKPDKDFFDAVALTKRHSGQALVAFVTLKGGVKGTPELREELRQHVAKEIGPVAKPDDIRFAEALSKTRSGKIMRRLLKQIASGVEIKGDTTTLEDFNVLAKLSGKEEGPGNAGVSPANSSVHDTQHAGETPALPGCSRKDGHAVEALGELRRLRVNKNQTAVEWRVG